MSNKCKLSFVIGGVIIALGVILGSYWSLPPSSATGGDSKSDSTTEDEVFTLDELADYLSVDKKKIEDIIAKDDVEKASLGDGSHDTYQFIPYVMISGKHLFLKKEILNWLEYQTHAYSNVIDN